MLRCLVCAGVMMVVAGLLVLPMPIETDDGWAGLIITGADAGAAPFVLVVELDPTVGSISLVEGGPATELRTSFASTAEFRVDIATGGGGPVGISVSDSNGPVVPSVSVEPMTQQYLSFLVDDEPVTVRFSSSTAQIVHLDMTTPVPGRRTRLVAVDRSSIVFATLVSGAGIAVVALALVRRPMRWSADGDTGRRHLGWALVTLAGLLTSFSPLWWLGRPLTEGPDGSAPTIMYFSIVGVPMAAAGAFALGRLSPTRERGRRTLAASVALTLAVLATALAAWFVEMELDSPDLEWPGIGFVAAAVVMIPTAALASVRRLDHRSPLRFGPGSVPDRRTAIPARWIIGQSVPRSSPMPPCSERIGNPDFRGVRTSVALG